MAAFPKSANVFKPKKTKGVKFARTVLACIAVYALVAVALFVSMEEDNFPDTRSRPLVKANNADLIEATDASGLPSLAENPPRRMLWWLYTFGTLICSPPICAMHAAKRTFTGTQLPTPEVVKPTGNQGH